MEVEIIKGNQAEMKNTLSEMRSILSGINKGRSKVNKEEDQMPYLEAVSYTHLTLPTIYSV